MRAEILDLWIKALRSGEFRQTIGRLKRPDGYCCLGLLCEVHRRVAGTKTRWRGRKSQDVYSYQGQTAHLPRPVAKWAGLKHTNPLLDNGNSATWANDEAKESFLDIAARLIKAQKRGLL